MWSDDDDYFSYSPYYYGSERDDSEEDVDLDVYCGYSSGEDLFVRPRRARTETEPSEDTVTGEVSIPTYQVPSLQDLCCRFIALKFPFAFVEHRSPPVPDDLQLKIIEFSFPEDEEMIRKYAEFSRSSMDYYSAKKMFEKGNVKDLNQIGFRLSATVEDRRYSYGRDNDSGKNYVTVLSDRGKITSAHCSCDSTTNWCAHVVATCLARIKDKNKMAIHMPVSDSLNSLDREQLLKFAQYLLSEHQNEPVVETAQKLLDRLSSQHQREQEDNINKIAGAPDPTAGPGLDEEAHWFVCKDGFKSRLESLMYESHQDLGFEMYNDLDRGRTNVGAVNEVWGRNTLQQALIRDEMDIQLDNDYNSGYPSSRRQTVLQVLETISDLLQGDFMSAVSALTMCTEQLVVRLTKLGFRDSPSYRLHRQEPKENLKLCGSLAGGFTPRMSGCRTLCDELSRLWRLAALKPGISTKQRQGVVDQLRTLNETVSAVLVTGPLRPWHGLEIAIRLSSIRWDSPDFQRVLKGEWNYKPSVSSWMVVHLTCQSKYTYLSEWVELEQCDSNTKRRQARDEASTPLTFYLPYCIALGPLCNMEIHSLCSMIEALNVGGEREAAMRLTVAVSYAIVSSCKSVFFGMRGATSMPVAARCWLGIASFKARVKTEESREHDCPMEVEGCDETSRNGHIWPEDTILSITTFAYLFELLLQNRYLAETSIVEMKSRLKRDSSAVDDFDCLKSSVSLRFQLGVIGLYLQRFPAPSLHHEVEEYSYECWLTYQLICCCPTEVDLPFLALLGQQVPQIMTSPNPAPPSSLCRVIFHHLFKGAPAALSKSLTEQQSIGLKAASSVLAYNNEHTVKENSSPWLLFQYANCRLWAKLAEVVLRSLSDSSELLSEAMKCVLKTGGMLGAQCFERISVDSTQPSVVSRLREVEFICGKSRVAYCLARALSERHGNTIRMTQYKTEARVRNTVRRETLELEMPRKIMKSGVDKALKECAVKISAHSLWLRKLDDRDYTRCDTVRWLTDFVVSSGADSLECLVSCRGDVSSFLEQSDLLNLCEKILNFKKEPDKRVVPIVQNILSSLLQKASRAEAGDDMKRIVSFCRDKRCARNIDLLSGVCKGLQSLEDSKSFVPFEVVMDASQGMLELYKERLSTIEREENQQEWARKGMGLKRLFSEGAAAEDESDNEDADSWSANRNPYRTHGVHPFLETAFELGMIGLERLKEKPDEVDRNRNSYYPRSCPVKGHLSAFCKLVCYLVNKKWMTDRCKVVTAIKSPKRESKTSSNASAKPGCSYWEDSYSESSAKVSYDACYLHKFVHSLINSVENPLWLFQVLQEFGEQLGADLPRSSLTSKQEKQNLQINRACQCYPSVMLLLQKDLDAFSKLLLGPKLSTLVKDVSRKRDRRHLEHSEVLSELGHAKVINTRLKEVLVVAKRAFSMSDSSGAKFKNLTDQLAAEHPILQTLLQRVLDNEELSSSLEREFFIPHGRVLPALFAQGLLPVFLEHNHLDDYF